MTPLMLQFIYFDGWVSIRKPCFLLTITTNVFKMVFSPVIHSRSTTDIWTEVYNLIMFKEKNPFTATCLPEPAIEPSMNFIIRMFTRFFLPCETQFYVFIPIVSDRLMFHLPETECFGPLFFINSHVWLLTAFWNAKQNESWQWKKRIWLMLLLWLWWIPPFPLYYYPCSYAHVLILWYIHRNRW